jgi:3-oxoacyl-[acyl-carrier protein] reductase
MDLGIRGRRAAVAAGSAGLGLATAAALAAEGVAVAVCGRHRDRLDEATARIGNGAVAVVADLAEVGAAEAFATEAAELLGGPLDIVVANARRPPAGPASATSLEDYERALRLNFLATVELCNAAVGGMRSAGWGRILAITSVGARQPIATLAASSAARAAVTSYVKNLADEVAADGVCANTIQPGSHATDRMKALAAAAPSAAARGIPVGHLGEPADFGRVAAFLCSAPAAFICGASIAVDGGASRSLL